MTDTPTPGQIAFAAYSAPSAPSTQSWTVLPDAEQARWEAAALAVLIHRPAQFCRACARPLAQEEDARG